MDNIPEKDLILWNKSGTAYWLPNDGRIINIVAQKFKSEGLDYSNRNEKILYIHKRNKMVRKIYKLMITGYKRQNVPDIVIPKAVEGIIYRFTENYNNYIAINEWNLKKYQARLEFHVRDYLDDD